LSNSDLRGVNFRNSNLCKTNFTGANLYGSDFRGAQGIDHLPNLFLLKAPGRISFLKEPTLDMLDYRKGDIDFFIQDRKLPSCVRQFALGFLNEIYGDPIVAARYYEQSANEGFLASQNNLAWMYEWGYG